MEAQTKTDKQASDQCPHVHKIIEDLVPNMSCQFRIREHETYPFTGTLFINYLMSLFYLNGSTVMKIQRENSWIVPRMLGTIYKQRHYRISFADAVGFMQVHVEWFYVYISADKLDWFWTLQMEHVCKHINTISIKFSTSFGLEAGLLWWRIAREP